MRYNEIYERGVQIIRAAGIEHWLDLGAETQAQNRLNRAYMNSLTFEMRLLGSAWADTRTALFGVGLPAPIMPAAMTSSRIIRRLGRGDNEWLEPFAAGIAQAGSLMWVGHGTNDELDQVMAQGAPVVKIVKPYRDNDEVFSQIEHATRRGAVAVGIDIDAMFLEKAFDEVPGPDFLGPKTMDELRAFRAATRLPFIVKGVLSVHDARVARDVIGADALVVSNHGGETIDYTVPILKILPEIRQAVPDLTLLVDSGFRRGSDALKALALGADGVCFATLLLIAFVAYESQGVADMLGILQEELQRAMTLTGCTTVKGIAPSIIRM
jgi:4-hydroxymandelate oxidase